MVMETDGDGSGGTSPSRQGAETETSVPRNSSAVAAELFLEIADSPRVFRREAFYRKRGVVRRQPWWPHNRWAWPGAGPCPPVVWASPGPPPTLVRSSILFGKNKISGTCFIQFREYFLCSFSETQKQQKIGNWHCGILLVG
jgi:hypothetical protein